MEMKQGTFLLINVVLVLVLIVGAGAIGWIVLGSNLDVSDAENKTKFARLMGSADLYFTRLNFYDGVCGDIGLPEGFGCNDNENSFALTVQLDSGWYYCGDSTGFTGDVPYSLGESTVCQR